MDMAEARGLLEAELSRLRALTYAELKRYFESEHKDVTGPSGKCYQLEIEAFYDGREQTDIRVMASIDDGGLRAFLPLTGDFLVRPDESFVGE